MVQERRRRSDLNGRNQKDQAQDSMAPVGIDEERVRQRAYERYGERGCEDGHDMDDWLEAERALRN